MHERTSNGISNSSKSSDSNNISNGNSKSNDNRMRLILIFVR